jgi:VIT1/CCC1 family predicted Fe2+/Mn2+ transporter
LSGAKFDPHDRRQSVRILARKTDLFATGVETWNMALEKHLEASEALAAEHTSRAIAERLAGTANHSYLRDLVLGAIDGVVTTFAVVAGVAGAEYPATVALVLGIANLAADGFSMAVGNYVGTKSEKQAVERIRRAELRHIRAVPDGEREEIRQIFAAKGFEGQLLEQVVEVITADEKRWVDTMVTEEFGKPLEMPSPMRAAMSTFAAFVVAGFVPLAPYCLPLDLGAKNLFIVSSIGTAVTFFLIGVAKGHVVQRSRWLSGIETLLIGGAAAVLAYGAGVLLQAIVPGAEF